MSLGDYRPWELNRAQPIKHDTGYQPSNEPFNANTTYYNDFKKHGGAPAKAIRPDQSAFQSQDPFDDRTGYREDYIKHNLPDKYARPREEYSPNKIPLDSLTTMRRDFTAKDADRQKSFKPEGTGYRSDAPFDDDTTHKTDFKKWEVAPHLVSDFYIQLSSFCFHSFFNFDFVFESQGRQNSEWQRPMGEMDLNTNYNTEFTPKAAQRIQAVRPSSRRLIDAKFEGDTTYGQDFRKWPGERRDLIRNPNEYTPSNAPFDGLSTYKGNLTHTLAIINCFR